MDETIPEGYCQCGCGGLTSLSDHDDKRYGYKNGQPKKFVHGHHTRVTFYPRRDLATVLNSKIEVIPRGHKTPCWIWQGQLNHGGYARKVWRKKTFRVHRYLYQQRYGQIAEELQLDHLCKVRACVNPEHLEAVTAAENTRRSSLTKLTETDVRQIRRLRSEGLTLRTLASRFKVSKSNIVAVVGYRSWRDV